MTQRKSKGSRRGLQVALENRYLIFYNYREIVRDELDIFFQNNNMEGLKRSRDSQLLPMATMPILMNAGLERV